MLNAVAANQSTNDGAVTTQGMQITWHNLNVHIGDRCLLSKINGVARPGEMLAVIGQTGAGKTTLLNTIAHRNAPSLRTSGHVVYGKCPWDSSLRSSVGYVEQEDVFFPDLTVREHLDYAARLRLPRTMTRAQKTHRVEEVIKLLRLAKCADTNVGGGMARGVSGGERKRLCIAIEMLMKPRVLIMDEPTSGLDSRMAQLVVEAMQDLARDHQLTIVATIHQPSSKVFHMFDQLCVVDEGHSIYFGPTDGAAAIFGKAGYPCPFSYNPSDFIMDLLVIQKLSNEAQQLLENTAAQRGNHMTPQLLDAVANFTHGEEEDVGRKYNSSCCDQLSVLIARTFKLEKGSILNVETFVLYIGMTAIIALLYLPTRNNFTEESLLNRSSLIFLLITIWVWFPLTTNAMTFKKQRVNISKELSAGAYPLLSFYVARTTAQIPIDLMWTVFNTPVLYFSGNLNTNPTTFILFFFWIWLQVLVQGALGMFIGALVEASMTCAMLVMTFMFIAGGFFVRLDQFGWLSFLKYVNPNVYAYEGLMKIVFNDHHMYECQEKSVYAACKNANGTKADLISGADVLNHYGVTRTLPVCLIAMIVFLVVWRVLGYFALYRSFAQDGTLTYPCCPHGCCNSATHPVPAPDTVSDQESKKQDQSVINMDDAIQEHNEKLKVYKNGLPPIDDEKSIGTTTGPISRIEDGQRSAKVVPVSDIETKKT